MGLDEFGWFNSREGPEKTATPKDSDLWEAPEKDGPSMEASPKAAFFHVFFFFGVKKGRSELTGEL